MKEESRIGLRKGDGRRTRTRIKMRREGGREKEDRKGKEYGTNRPHSNLTVSYLDSCLVSSYFQYTCISYFNPCLRICFY